MGRKIGAAGLTQHNDKFYGNYRGTVMGNVDPDQLGRIKIKIYPMLSGVETENLPWAIPAMPLSSGAGLDVTDPENPVSYGNFWVPDTGSNVWVFFEAGDIYQPVYFAEATDGLKGLPSDIGEDYPNTSIVRTKTGIQIKINRTKDGEEIKIDHPSGTTLDILPDGNVQVMVVKEDANIYLKAGKGNVNIEATNNEINLIAGGSINIDAPETITTGNLRAGTGDTGSFVDGTGKVIEVSDGIITGGVS
jgi:hypothetical protein